MTVRLLVPYGKYLKNTNITTGAAAELDLLRSGMADTNTQLGVAYAAPATESLRGVISRTQSDALVSNNWARLGAIAAAAGSIDPTRYKRVMASPPTVVYASASLAAITPRVRYQVGYQDATLPLSSGSMGTSHFRLHGARKLVRAAGTDPRFEYLKPAWRTRNTAPPLCDHFCVSYETESRYFEQEFMNLSTGFTLYVKVNDSYVSITPQGYDAGVTVDGKAYYSLDFGAAGTTTRIDVIGYGCYLGSASVQGPYALRPAATRGPTDAFAFGDSWIADYTADSNGIFTQAREMQEHLGWDDLLPAGSGSTGYASNYNGAEYTYLQRLSLDVLPYNPKFIDFDGSVNDDDKSYSAIYAGALACYRLVQEAAPACVITVGLPPMTAGPGFTTVARRQNRAAVRDAAIEAGVLWYDEGTAPMDPATAPYTTRLRRAVSNSATFTTEGLLAIRSHYEFPDGSRFECLNSTGYPATITADAAMTQAAGALVTQVGNSLMTGDGYSGGTITVAGTAGLYMNADGTPHLSPLGVRVRAMLKARSITRVLQTASLRA